jgi:hypothetical protein
MRLFGRRPRLGRSADEGDGWVNWSELATLMAGPYHQVELSVNRLLWLFLAGHDAAGASRRDGSLKLASCLTY